MFDFIKLYLCIVLLDMLSMFNNPKANKRVEEERKELESRARAKVKPTHDFYYEVGGFVSDSKVTPEFTTRVSVK